MSLDEPDVVASCERRWHDTDGNDVDIKVTACVECVTPTYFNALRRETMTEQI